MKATLPAIVQEGWLEETLGENEVVNIECGPVKTALSLDDFFERTDLSA